MIDAQGNVYVANAGSDSETKHRWIQELTGDGTFLSKWGSSGVGTGEFIQPNGLGIDGQGNIYVDKSPSSRGLVAASGAPLPWPSLARESP